MWSRPVCFRVFRATRPGTTLQRLVASVAQQNEGRVATAAGAPATSTILEPPGMDADAGAIESFSTQVASMLQDGSKFEMVAKGQAARLQALRALANGCHGGTSHFELATDAIEMPRVNEAGEGVSSRSSWRPEATRFLAWRGAPMDFRNKLVDSMVVFGNRSGENENHPALNLAKRLAVDLRTKDAMTMQTDIGKDRALNKMIIAVAIVRKMADIAPPLCSVGVVLGGAQERQQRTDESEGAGSKTMKLVLHVQRQKPPESGGAKDAERDFIVYPPLSGKSPEEREKRLQSFQKTVRDAIARGGVVTMELHGPGVAAEAMVALSMVRMRVAECTVKWVTSASDSSGIRMVQLRCAKGTTFKEFNSTDFKKTYLLQSREDSKVSDLAKIMLRELKSKGGVAMHARLDRLDAVWVAMKSIASIPYEGMAPDFVVIPTIGKPMVLQKGGDKGKEVRLLRLYLERLPSGSVWPRYAERTQHE